MMTYVEPSTGERVGLSFIVPTTKDDLARRSAMNKVWADATLGFMGRTPDYLNVNVMAAGMAADYFSQKRPPVRPQHGRLLRSRPRARPGPDARAHQPAGRPIEAASRARRSVHRARRRPRDQRRDHRPWRADAGDAADLRRDPDLPVDGAEARRRHEAVRDVVRRSRTTRPGSRSSAANRSISAARTPTTRSARASTRWTRWSTSTTCSCRGSGCS